jgi:hypothetical protein
MEPIGICAFASIESDMVSQIYYYRFNGFPSEPGAARPFQRFIGLSDAYAPG